MTDFAAGELPKNKSSLILQRRRVMWALEGVVPERVDIFTMRDTWTGSVKLEVDILRPCRKQQDGLAVHLHQHELETVFTIAARALIRQLILLVRQHAVTFASN